METFNDAAQRTISLRPYQQEALAAIAEAESRGIRRQLVSLPTGTGKTVIFAHLLQQRSERALVLAHRDELIEQAASKIRTIDPLAQVGICKAERDEWQHPITVGSVQTISRHHRLERIPRDRYHTIIIDECHHATADSYCRILAHFGAFSSRGPLAVGFTATPERADEQELGAVFEEIVFRRDIESMIREGYLCDLRAVQVKVAVDYGSLRTRAGDYDAEDLGNALQKANAPEHVAAAYLEHAAGRKALVFTPTIALSHIMAKAFTKIGVAAEALSGETPLDERRSILARLKSGRTMVVANCAVLTEGYDEPSIDCIIMARPTQSQPMYIQMVGRGTRIFPCKSNCVILDLVGATSRHKLVTAATLFKLDPHRLSEVGVSEALEERDSSGPRTLDIGPSGGRHVAREVALFGRERLNTWEPFDEGCWKMNIAGQAILIRPDGVEWTVLVSRGDDCRSLASGLSLEYAQGVGEDYARSLLKQIFADQNAGWRKKPATPAQIAMLHKFRIHTSGFLTAGEASDLISQTIEALKRRRSA
jgi:ATP-dependent helicase IRC3